MSADAPSTQTSDADAAAVDTPAMDSATADAPDAGRGADLTGDSPAVQDSMDAGVADTASPDGRALPGFCQVDQALVDSLLAAMSVEDKAGQVLIVGASGAASGPSQETATITETAR